MRKGKVYLIGAGPGDDGLLTFKAKACIERADVIIYDYLANKKFLDFADKKAEIVYVGKKGSDHTLPQWQINKLIIQKAKEGKKVARLKGGDPFVFGRGGEEAEELIGADVAFEAIPGVTSVISVPAYAGIPLTHRDYTSTVAFITGHEDPTKESSNIAWDKIATGIGTLIFIMGVKNLPNIVKNLLDNGRSSDTPVAIIRWGTTPRQKTILGSLNNIIEIAKSENITPPSIIVVGEVINLRKKLNWFETRPLFGKRIIVTRARTQSSDFANLLGSNGALPIQFPTIETVPPDTWDGLDDAIEKISSYEWLIFTSVNGVRYFFERLKKKNRDVRDLKGIKICTIGPKTAMEVEKFGIRIDVIPSEYRAEAVIECIGKENIHGKRVLLPRAAVAREILPDELKNMGALIDVVDAYKTIRPDEKTDEIKKMLTNKEVDVITFTSSSTVTNFVDMFDKYELQEMIKGVVIASIGPITAETAEKLGLKPQIIPKKYTIESFTDEIIEYYQLQSRQ